MTDSDDVLHAFVLGVKNDIMIRAYSAEMKFGLLKEMQKTPATSIPWIASKSGTTRN